MTFIRKEGRYWKIYYYLGGRKRKISTRTQSKTFAEKLKLKFENDLAARKFNLNLVPDSHISLKDFFSEAEEYSRINKSPNTVIREKFVFDLFKKFMGENKPIRTINSKMIEEYKNHLAQNHTNSGININLRHLQAAFSLAQKYGYISENPFKNVQKVPVPKKQPIFLSQVQAGDLLKSTRDHHIHQFIIIALFTGCRISEIANLTWDRVNLKDKYIRVIGKGNKERTIPIPGRLVHYLKTKSREGSYVISGSRSRNDATHEFRIFADKLNLVGFTFHNLRDTYASWLAQAGESILTIKELLGHSTIQTTMVYAHLSQKTLKNAIRSLDF